MKIPFTAKAVGSEAQSWRPKRNRQDNNQRLSWALTLAFGFVALFIGVIGGLDSPILLTMAGGTVFAILLFFLMRLQNMLLVLILITFVIQGSAMYFLGLRSATWVAVGFSVLYFFKALLELTGRRKEAVKIPTDARCGFLAVCALLYVCCFFMSIVFNRVSLGQTAASIKAGLPMFSVLFAFFCFQWESIQLEKVWKFFILIMLLQLPVVAYQHFFIATARTFDSIVGTFGGTPQGGGNSAILVFFVITVMTYCFARWDQKLMPGTRLVLICLTGIAIIFLGEVKAAFIWVPLTSFWVLRKRIFKNVFSLFTYCILIVVFMGATYMVYNALYWGKVVDKGHTISEKLNAGGGYFFDPTNVNYVTGEISRGASIALWVNDHTATIPKRLVGFGPGSSKLTGLLAAGDVARRYAPLHIDATTLAILLWDVGLLGTAAYILMLFAGIFAGWRFISKRRGTPAERAMMEACVTMLALYMTMLIYNRALMDEPTAQLLFMLTLGTVVQLCRFSTLTDAVEARSDASPMAPYSRTVSR